MGLGEPQSTFDVLECRFVQGKEKATISADRASKRALATTPISADLEPSRRLAAANAVRHTMNRGVRGDC